MMNKVKMFLKWVALYGTGMAAILAFSAGFFFLMETFDPLFVMGGLIVVLVIFAAIMECLSRGWQDD